MQSIFETPNRELYQRRMSNFISTDNGLIGFLDYSEFILSNKHISLNKKLEFLKDCPYYNSKRLREALILQIKKMNQSEQKYIRKKLPS